jgi:hypothetical protein
MSNKYLTESGLKAILAKHKVKDNGSLKVLAAFEDVDDDDHDELLMQAAQVGKFAAALKRTKEVVANKTVSDFVQEVIDAAIAAEKEARKNAEAARNGAAKQQKADKVKEKEDEEDEGENDEEEEGGYGERLMSAFKKLKSMNGKPLAFIVCDARPLPNIMVAKRITPKHKEELTELTGGSRKFLKVGSCHFADDQYFLEMDQTVPGLARKVQKAVKVHTGKKLKFSHGGETAGDEEDGESPEQETQQGEQDGDTTAIDSSIANAVREAIKAAAQPVSSVADAVKSAIDAATKTNPTIADLVRKAIEEALPKPVEPPSLGKGDLGKAPEIWRNTRDIVTTNIGELKKTVKIVCSGEDPSLVKRVEKNLTQLDGIISKLDGRLADALDEAKSANDAASRAASLKTAKGVLVDYIKYVKSEPLIAHIDANPFGVQTNLKKILSDSLTNMAQSIG